MNEQEMQNHILFTEGAGRELMDKGEISGPSAMTPKGIASYDQLMASGWMPKRYTVRLLLSDKGVPASQLDRITDMLMQVVGPSVTIGDAMQQHLEQHKKDDETLGQTLARLLGVSPY